MRLRRVIGIVVALVVLGIAGLGTLLYFDRLPAATMADHPGFDGSYEAVTRGRAVAIAADCVACHSLPGGKPYAGGLVLETPFGKLAAPNITPDIATGIGTYTLADLKRTIRDGIGKGGKHLYPAMPYPAYSGMTDDDISALWSYLNTLEPASNAVDVNQLPFPFNIRLSLIGWNLVNFGHKGSASLREDKSAEWNRGRYLVDALGHCGTCHTPKNLIGGDHNADYLKGGVLEGWVAPNITADPHKGIGAWSKADLVSYLKTGVSRQAIASGPMAEAIVNSTSKMPDADLASIAAYLLDTGPAVADVARPLDAGDQRMRVGAAIYKDMCAACHFDSGSGATAIFPTLAGNPAIQQDDPTTLIRVVLNGSRGVATDAMPTAPAMPPLGWRLDDDQVAAVVTYIRNAWGNAAPAVTAGDVRAMRQALAHR